MNTLRRTLAALDVIFNSERQGESTLEYVGNLLLSSPQLIFGGRVFRIYHKGDHENGGEEGYRIIEERKSWKNKAELTGNIALSIVFLPVLPIGMVVKTLSLIDPEVRKENLKLMEMIEKELTPLVEHSLSTGEISDLDFLSQLPSDIKKQMMELLSLKDTNRLSETSKHWLEVGRRRLIEILYPASLIKLFGGLEEFRAIPMIKLKAHKAGVTPSGSPLVQEFGSQETSQAINFIKPSEMKHHPIVRFIDPWGRPGIAIRYIHRIEDREKHFKLVENVLILHPKELNINDKWICVVKPNEKTMSPDASSITESSPVAFFPKGCEKNEKSLKYLQNLLEGKPCGLPIIDQNKIEEGPALFLSKNGTEQPVIELWHPHLPQRQT